MHKLTMPVGRFAPSPTGNLHIGSLTTALASYCHIKSMGGRWLLRLEDTDYQRCDNQFSRQILIDLKHLGLRWDGDVWYQSERTAIYRDYFNTYLKQRSYACHCSRKQLQDTDIYPRCCLHKKIALNDHKVRVQLPNYSIGFLDALQGIQWANPQQSLGDVVLYRADGIINYFLAVAVDDGLQGVTHVMRGLDILPLTTAQISLMSYVKLPAIASWSHLPLVVDRLGKKLSKQNLAEPIDTSTPDKCSALIIKALSLLQQPAVIMDTPERMLEQAVSQWDMSVLEQQTAISFA